jgi:hypothetical protein
VGAHAPFVTDCFNAGKTLDFWPKTCNTNGMRKIESQMNKAITENRDWKLDNTEVVTVDGVSTVYLHNNKIAEVGDNFVRLYDGGYQSTTTKSRLNAILAEHGLPGECVFQKEWKWFVKVKTSTELATIPFFSSMRLN